MSDEQENEAEPVIVHAVRRLPPAEQHRLLEWSRGLGAIRYGALRGGKKAAAILRLTRDSKAVWPLAKVMLLALRHVVWDARSWMFRLGLGGIIATFVMIGNAGAGIVTLGGGIGLPLWMLIGAGGALIGRLTDWTKARMRTRYRQ